jgi:7,8-dihydro-6-hydroxymethylpterin dimethyltransferase
MPLQQDTAKKCCGAADPSLPPIPAAEGALKAMAYVRRQWAAPDETQKPCNTDPNDAVISAGVCTQGNALPSLEAFVSRARNHTLSVSAMAFQDVWNVDLNRVRDCCIHVMAPDHRLIPFCLYNLTSSDGRRLYRK